MIDLKRWAALDRDGYIIVVGMTNPLVDRRFDRRCFSMSCGDYFRWVSHGARYCELLVDSFNSILGSLGGYAKSGLHISDIPHGRIRKSKDVF